IATGVVTKEEVSWELDEAFQLRAMITQAIKTAQSSSSRGGSVHDPSNHSHQPSAISHGKCLFLNLRWPEPSKRCGRDFPQPLLASFADHGSFKSVELHIRDRDQQQREEQA